MQHDQESELDIGELISSMGEPGFPDPPPTPEGEGKEKPVRIPMMENIMSVVNMLHGSEGTVLPAFPQKFHTQTDDKGELLYLIEEPNGVCRYVLERHIANCVLNFCKTTIPIQFRHQFWKMALRDAKEAVHQWAAQAKPIEDPAMVLQKSTPGRTFHRLPFDMKTTKTPLFDEFMDRTSNKKAIMAWIGSIFDPEADTQQYVWLYGPGKNGKSSLGKFLHKCLGPAATYEQVPRDDDRFWTYGLLGKRLIIFGDCNNARFVTTGKFKGITGGDGVKVEEKGGGSFTKMMRTKPLFFSNNKPSIDDEEADVRRIILGETGPLTVEVDPDYDAKLWAEAPGILQKCFDEYRAVSGPRMPIPTENDLAAHIFDEQDEKFDSFFIEFLAYSERADDRLPRSDVNSAICDWFGLRQPSIPLLRQFKGYLKRRKIHETRNAESRDGRKVNGYMNVVAKKSLVV